MITEFPSRRNVCGALGVIVASFALLPAKSSGQAAAGLPTSFRVNPNLDSWIRIDADGGVTVFTGKAELGQGILTALAQIAAEELDVGFDVIRILGADTSRGPDEQYTYGSQSIEQSGAALRAAAAEARSLVLADAARRFGTDVRELRTENGVIFAPGGRSESYWNIVSSDTGLLNREATKTATKDPSNYRIVGKSVPRIDLPAKIAGQAAYLQDIRLPNMAFGRVVRPPCYGAKLLSVETDLVSSMAGVISVVRNGDFLGVIANREEQAIAARQKLIEISKWSSGEKLPDMTKLDEELPRWRDEGSIVATSGKSDVPVPGGKRIEASYSRPYLSQASIGPSCAIAWLREDHMIVWSHTQGAFPLRGDIATVLGKAKSEVDVIHVAGSGCYGHNGADDVALDAALLARAVAGKPVKVQWMRDDEFGWAPFGPAMLAKAKASLSDQGKIVDWDYQVWSNSHAMRPGQPGGVNLLAAWHLEKPFQKSPPLRIPQPAGDGDRNAVPYYELPRKTVFNHLLMDAPIRNGSLRTLGAHGNVFAIESFMDELALAAGHDPIAFRLSHLKDPRAVAVLGAVAEKAMWKAGAKGDGMHGRGVAFARYKNIGTYAAVVVDVEVKGGTGEVRVPSVTIAVDVGKIVNPDGARSQIEGGIVQAISMTLKEQVTFDSRGITSRDWSDYPILSFPEVPAVDIVLIDRTSEPSLGAGEGSLAPTSAALANAFANATGRRIRDLPMSPERVKKALAG